MAYVISVCGAGGKTTYIYERAHEYLKQNKTVAVLTTTRMIHDKKLSGINDIKDIENIKNAREVFTFGNVKDRYIVSVSDEEYKKICDAFDIVIIEADGSRCMPVKIPNIATEPVIKENTDEIVLVYSPFAYGRNISDVCFRYDEFKDDKFFVDNGINENTLLNKELIEKIYSEFYVKRLFDKNKISFKFYETDIYKNHNEKDYKNITLVLLCAGKSSRFDPVNHKNKLMAEFDNKPLYKYMYDKLVFVKENLLSEFKKLNHNINIDINIITNEDNNIEITNGIFNDINIIKNNKSSLGLSSSIILATEYNIDKDAICFFNADMPLLKVEDITNMIKYTILSNMHNGAMYLEDSEDSNNSGFKNPAIFHKKYFDEILKIEGDKGPKAILDKHEFDTYKYHIDKTSLTDIDTEEKYYEIKRITNN